MYGSGVTKQVVHITKNLLVRTYQEDAQIVLLILLQRMHWQRMRVMAVGSKIGYLSVRVAGNILNGGITGRTLVQTLDGHNGEYLVDGPRVRQRLEQREVAEILVCQQLVDIHQLLWHVLQVLRQCMNLVTDAPVHRLNLCTRLQIDDTMREEVEHLLTNLLSIVPVFQHIAWTEVVPYLIEILHQLMAVLVRFKLLRHLWQ